MTPPPLGYMKRSGRDDPPARKDDVLRPGLPNPRVSPSGPLTTSCMVSRGPSLTCSGPVRSRGGAGRESSRRAVKLIGPWGSFLAGDQSGDGGQHHVEVL